MDLVVRGGSAGAVRYDVDVPHVRFVDLEPVRRGSDRFRFGMGDAEQVDVPGDLESAGVEFLVFAVSVVDDDQLRGFFAVVSDLEVGGCGYVRIAHGKKRKKVGKPTVGRRDYRTLSGRVKKIRPFRGADRSAISRP